MGRFWSNLSNFYWTRVVPLICQRWQFRLIHFCASFAVLHCTGWKYLQSAPCWQPFWYAPYALYSLQMTGWEYVHSSISPCLQAFLRKYLQVGGVIFVVVVSGARCGLVVCFCFGDRCPHDICEEFVEFAEFVELMSVVVAVCVWCSVIFTFCSTAGNSSISLSELNLFVGLGGTLPITTYSIQVTKHDNQRQY